MIQTYFGQINDGTILRLPFLGFSLLLAAIVIAFGLVVALTIGAAEHLMGGDLQQAQAQLKQRFGYLAVVLIFMFGIVVFFASLNIMAKRIRDIGLPGWWSILAIAVLQGVITTSVSQEAASGLQTLVWLALLFIPSNAMTRSQ